MRCFHFCCSWQKSLAQSEKMPIKGCDDILVKDACNAVETCLNFLCYFWISFSAMCLLFAVAFSTYGDAILRTVYEIAFILIDSHSHLTSQFRWPMLKITLGIFCNWQKETSSSYLWLHLDKKKKQFKLILTSFSFNWHFDKRRKREEKKISKQKE